jgi:hypothetical protein
MVNVYILIVVYYYCFKIYGIKTTLITNFCLSSLILSLIFTGLYSAADLETDFPFLIMKIGDTEFFVSDIITIFTIFIIVFELARFTLKKPKGTDLSIIDVIFISVLVSIYGILLQMLMDPTAAVMGLYYYQNPPSLNIFGFPIWFITSFSIYGLYALVFLLFERYFYQKRRICKSILKIHNNFN